MKKCKHCGYEFKKDTFQGFTFPYGFKKVQRVEVKIKFCANCEEILNTSSVNKGEF